MRFWQVLNGPDNFASDPYGELTNQLGHTMLGLVLSLFIVCAWREAAGEMPYRVPVLVTVSIGYLVAIECLAQGWKSGDSWFDWIMVTFGSAGILLPVREIDTEPGATMLRFDHAVLSWIMGVWALALALRVARRVRTWT